jgi:ribosome-binding protein aMBF1 (putative translation factor)
MKVCSLNESKIGKNDLTTLRVFLAGRGIPNQQVLGKIEKVIGMKLRGKDKGQPLLPPGKK